MWSQTCAIIAIFISVTVSAPSHSKNKNSDEWSDSIELLKPLNDQSIAEDYYSGSWKAQADDSQIELFIWYLGEKTNTFDSNNIKKKYWKAFLHFTGENCLFFLQGNEYLNKDDRFFHKVDYEYDFSGKALKNERLCWDQHTITLKNGKKFGQLGYLISAVDDQNIKMRDFDYRGVEESARLYKKIENNGGSLIFSRSNISKSFSRRINYYSQSQMNESFIELLAPERIPNAFAANRALDTNYKLKPNEYVDYKRENDKEAQFDEIVKYDHFDGNKLSLNQCGIFYSDDATKLISYIKQNAFDGYYYAAIDGYGFSKFSGKTGDGPYNFGLSMNNSDIANSKLLCNKNANAEEIVPTCPFCFYDAGGLLDSIYHGNLERSKNYAKRYTNYHQGEFKDKHLMVFKALSNYPDLSLIEDVLGSYMKSYPGSGDDCFQNGSFELRREAYFDGYRLVNGLGQEIIKVDPSQTVDTYHLNKEFEKACQDLCMKHGFLLMSSQVAFLSKDSNFVKEQKRLVMDVFIGLDRLQKEYSCNSPVRKRFEKNILKFYDLLSS